MKTFSHLADVPVHYDRYSAESGFGYGTRGKPFNPRATATMVRRLERTKAALQDLGLNTNISTRATWVAFLQATASRAFALAQ